MQAEQRPVCTAGTVLQMNAFCPERLMEVFLSGVHVGLVAKSEARFSQTLQGREEPPSFTGPGSELLPKLRSENVK